MGNEMSGSQFQMRIADKWVFQRDDPVTKVRILKNRQGQLGHQYMITYNNKYNIHDEMDIYKYRKQQDRALVRILGAELQQARYGSFCGVQQILKVITEQIVCRLPDIPCLSFRQSMYLLNEALIGFNEIYKRVGLITITQKMIGVTPEGHVRVWLNQNFAQNHQIMQKTINLRMTNYNFLPVDPKKYQNAMVNNLLEIVQKHLHDRAYSAEFKYEIESARSLDFLSAQTTIFQYVQQHHLQIPDRIDLYKLQNHISECSESHQSEQHNVKHQSKVNIPMTESRYSDVIKPINFQQIHEQKVSQPNRTSTPNRLTLRASQMNQIESLHPLNQGTFNPNAINNILTPYHNIISPGVSRNINENHSPIVLVNGQLPQSRNSR